MHSLSTATTDPGHLRQRLSGFIAHLRSNEFVIGQSETLDLLSVLARHGLADIVSTRQRMKILLCSDQSQWRNFDQLFESYWHTRGRLRQSPRNTQNPLGATAQKMWNDHLQASGSGGKPLPQIEGQSDDASGSASGRLIASTTRARGRTDLRYVSDAQETAAIEQLARRLARAIRYRLSRRYRVAANGAMVDLRRTLRASIGHGGEPFRLIRKSTPKKPVRLLVFLDVSGSMKHYSKFFLQFVKGLTGVWTDTDVYLFHTRLIRVTDTLQQRDAMVAMSRLALIADGFGGGTRLGDSLQTFNRRYAKMAVNSRSVAIIVSDGYDTGSPEQLAEQLATMKKRCRRLVWLNPLLGWKDYQPVNAAMTAAMPYIDTFAAANTLESMAAIEPILEQMR